MAALLYLGEYIHARHLWRRHRDAAPANIKAALEDWWNLGRALMEQKPQEVWPRLQHLQQSQPKPFCDYAQEVGDQIRRRWIPKVAALWSKPDAVLLGLPRQEWVVFLEKYRQAMAVAKKEGRDITETISFLETPVLVV